MQPRGGRPDRRPQALLDEARQASDVVEVRVRDDDVIDPEQLARGERRDVAQVEQDRAALVEEIDELAQKGTVTGATFVQRSDSQHWSTAADYEELGIKDVVVTRYDNEASADPLTQEVEKWWPKSFCMDPGRTIGFHMEFKLGGRMYEDWGDGNGWLWWTISAALRNSSDNRWAFRASGLALGMSAAFACKYVP